MKKGKPMAIGAAIALALGAFIVLAKCSRHPASPFSSEIEKSQGDTIDVGIMLNPTVYYPQGDTIVGRDYEILQRISAERGLPMKFHPFVPLGQALENLDAGLYDMLVATMPLTASLKDKYLMTNPVYTDKLVLVQQADSAMATSLLQLAGDTVWIADSQPVAERMANLSAEIGDTIYLKSSSEYTDEHLLMLVGQGVLRRAVVNERIARELLPSFPDVDASLPISFTQFQAWAVSPQSPELRDSLNAWLP